MTAIEKAKAHFNYGINCDIFSEPVRSYAKMAVIALEKQIPKKCKKFKDTCSCGYGVFPHMNFCSQCGQALDWSDTE